MKLSIQSSSIVASPTLALNDLAKKLKMEGKPIINLGVGEPLNLTPLSAIEMAKQRLDTRSIKYTPSSGNQDLKDAISRYTQEHYGISPNSGNILVASGAKQAIFNALVAILNPGEEVILLAPYWVSYPEMVKIAGGRPKIVSPRNNHFLPDLNRLHSSITPTTKAVILNSPNNPSGIIFPPDDIADIVTLCEENEIYLILDDIYHQLVFGSTPWVPGYRFTSKDIDNSHIIVINGISKTYGMTGFRVGWATTAQKIISVMSNIQSQTTSGVSTLLQDAALGALSGSQDDVAELHRLIKSNREATLSALNTIPGVRLIEPHGTFYCLPDFSYYDSNSVELSKKILEIAYVAVVPGIAFGMEGHLRISYAGNQDEILEGIERIHKYLESGYP
jgi:aspartate aminotransferase